MTISVVREGGRGRELKGTWKRRRRRASGGVCARLDILCAWIGHPIEKWWPFEFLESFRCSISSVSICDAAESDLRVKCYDHWNFSRAYVVQFWACRYLMRPNMTSVWKVMTSWISWELLLFNFERLDILCARIGHPWEKWWPIEFLESFWCLISSVLIYYNPDSDLSVKSYDRENPAHTWPLCLRTWPG